MSEPNPFGRLAPYLRKYIYDQNWDQLHPMQLEAITAVLDTKDHVLLAGQTASGKTEAAFLPILTDLHENPGRSVAVLYVGPLKALINDQFGRLEGVLRHAGMPVTAWHGDASQAAKKRLAKRPAGVLQITPESLEAFFQFRREQIPDLFHDLRYVVVDEVHAFMAGDRGGQLQSLLARLERAAGATPRRVGLSATLGDYGLAEGWLRGASDTNVITIPGQGKRRLRMTLDHFEAPKKKRAPDADGAEERSEGVTLAEMPDLVDRAFTLTRNGKSLIFVNRRVDGEDLGAALGKRAEHHRLGEMYHVHHGSISRDSRHAAEEAMRTPGRPACTIATVTLELGIDLGQLERMVQVKAPGTVNSFVQRLGRTGRRGGVGEAHLMTLEGAHREDVPPLQKAPWDLIQAVAMVDSYVKHKWVEPLPAPRLPISLLYHQTMSILKERGDLTPPTLAQAVLTLPPFRGVTKEEYTLFLRHLVASDQLEKTESKTLMFGQKGERIVDNYRFLATFEDTNDIKVVHGDRLIGTVPKMPPAGTAFRLGGKAWNVTSTDEESKTVFVRHSKQAGAVEFDGLRPDIHDRVVKHMRDVLKNDDLPPYLTDRAKERLTSARAVVREMGVLDQVLHEENGFTTVTPWVGSAGFRGMMLKLHEAFGASATIHVLNPNLQARVKAPAREVEAVLERPLDLAGAAEMVSPLDLMVLGRFESLAPLALRRRAFVESFTEEPNIEWSLDGLPSGGFAPA